MLELSDGSRAELNALACLERIVTSVRKLGPKLNSSARKKEIIMI